MVWILLPFVIVGIFIAGIRVAAGALARKERDRSGCPPTTVLDLSPSHPILWKPATGGKIYRGRIDAQGEEDYGGSTG